MNVKISYTIPFEAIPKTVEGLLGQSITQLEQMSNQLLNVSPSSDGEIYKQLEILESARDRLVEIDTRIKECYGILSAYNKTKAELALAREDSNTDAENSI
jgi:hypothetical protein